MVLACGAELGRDGRRMVLRLSAAGKRREMFAECCRMIFYWDNRDFVAVESG